VIGCVWDSFDALDGIDINDEMDMDLRILLKAA
jgi:hypothetical protein